MGINDASKFIADIYKLGNWRLIIVLFGCISSFTIGAIIELGINFLPIIDKIHMISIIGFYVLAFYFTIVIVSHIWRYLFTRRYAEDEYPIYISILLDSMVSMGVFGAAFAVFYIIRDMSETSYSSRNISFILVSFENALSMGLQNTFLIRLIIFFLFILALKKFMKLIIHKLSGEFGKSAYRRVSNQLSLCLVPVLMMVFLEAGSVWTRIAYFTPPMMMVSYVEATQPSVRVGIVMRAQNGFIGIADGNRFPEYFGWNSIRRITPIGRE